jgi:hypothetical protein
MVYLFVLILSFFHISTLQANPLPQKLKNSLVQACISTQKDNKISLKATKALCECSIAETENEFRRIMKSVPQDKKPAVQAFRKTFYKNRLAQNKPTENEKGIIVGAGLSCMAKNTKLKTPLSELQDKMDSSGSKKCNVKMTSNFVSNTYTAYDEALSAKACLEKCKGIAQRRVNPMSTSDQITKLSWACEFAGKDIHTETLK